MINQVKKEVRKVSKVSSIIFMKQGDPLKTSRKYEFGILHKAKDWVMEVDKNQQLQFPEVVCISTKRPDVVIYLLNLRKVILIDLTCPIEENIEEKHSEKLSRYEGLVTGLTLVGKFTCLP